MATPVSITDASSHAPPPIGTPDWVGTVAQDHWTGSQSAGKADTSPVGAPGGSSHVLRDAAISAGVIVGAAALSLAARRPVSPEAVETLTLGAGELSSESGAGLAGELAAGSRVNGLAAADTITGPGANLVRAATAIERPIDLSGTGLHSLVSEAGAGTGRVTSNFTDSTSAIYTTNQRLARFNIPAITGMARSGFPARGIQTLDDTTQVGRVYNASKEPFALVVRMGRTARDPFTSGSGVAVRSDGLVAAARHSVTDPSATGDIWVRFPNQPIPPFKARIAAERDLEDIVLLKPIAPLTRPVTRVGQSMFASSVSPGAELLTVGAPDVSLTTGAAPTITGDMYASTGRMMGKGDLVHYLSEPNAFMYRTSITADYGMSGGATYDLRTGKFIGTMQAGRDYQWSAVTPAEKIRSLLLRTP